MSDKNLAGLLWLAVIAFVLGTIFFVPKLKQARPIQYHDMQAFCPHCGQPLSNPQP